MTSLRIINLIAWAIVLAYMSPAVIGIIRGKARTGDPARLVCAAYAMLVIGFNLRWLLIPENAVVQAVLYVLSVVVAAITVKSARSYGRGRHV